MASRITSTMLTKNYMSDLNRNLNNMQTLQSQLSSGKEINRPSDNPYKAARSMQLYTEISANNQYKENIKDVSNWVDITDTSLGQLETSLGRIRDLLLSAGNGAYGDDERKANQDEIKVKVSEIAQILNTNFDGAYIFGGTKSTSKPVTVVNDPVTGNPTLQYADASGAVTTDPDVLNQIQSSLKIEISQGVFIDYNKTATDVMEYGVDSTTGKSKNISDLLNDIITNLNEGNYDSDKTQDQIKELDNAISNLLQKRSEVGATSNRVETAESKNSSETLSMKDILSQTEDIDFAEKMIEYSIMQTVYTASLQTSAKVLPQTILDYL